MTRRTRLPGLFGRITAIADDHARLNGNVAKLRQLAASLKDAAEPTSSELRELAVECERLQTAMKRHFAAEEANSYFGVLMTEDPSTCATIVELCAEHAQMLEMLEDLVRTCASDSPDPELIGAVAQGLSRLADRLESHEAVESRLMQEFLLGVDPAAHR